MVNENVTVKDAAFPTFIPPGISFTAPEKSRPWQQPPKLVSVEQVVNFYMMVLTAKEGVDNLLDSLETGLPLSTIAESIMLGSVSQGIHTIDAGILVMPIIIELLITAAIVNKVDYVVYGDELDKEEISPRAARMAAKKAIAALDSRNNIEEEQNVVEEEQTPMGLMAKKNVEV